MSKYAFDTALAARRSASLAGALTSLSPFLELGHHAMEREAFPAGSLAWSASREPLAMTVLHQAVPVWTVIASSGEKPWVVSRHGTPVPMTLQEALLHLAHLLAALATTSDRVRFEWRSDGTIGGSL